MNIKTRSKYRGLLTRFFSELLFLIVVFVVLVLSSCSLIDQVDQSSCSVDMGKRVTIDVTDVEARAVFDQVAQELDCPIKVDPVLRQRLTLKMENATVAEILAVICGEKDVCKYTYDGTHLTISHLSFLDKLRFRARERDDQARDEWLRKFTVQLPEGMVYEDATVSSVLAKISTVSGLEITPWEGEGDRRVTLDLSGMTVDEALEAIVRYIDGEGAVMVKTWNGGNAQHRLVDKP